MAEPKTVYVTSAHVMAAKTLVRRAEVTGKSVSNALRKIADAKPDPNPRLHPKPVTHVALLTTAQVLAAQELVRRAAENGSTEPEAVHLIANAQPASEINVNVIRTD